MTTLRNSVGERIRAIRKMKGLTQQQLAELSGLDDAYIGSVERGERNFSIDTLEKIISGLNISPYDLFYNQDKNNDEYSEKYNSIEEYSIILSSLSPKQIQAIRKIVRALKEGFI